jgi:hypothetical protein
MSFYSLINYSLADDYVIEDVVIEAEAISAKIARNKAIEDGQRRALVMLVKKLAPNFDTATLASLNENQLANMVKDFELQDEKMSATSYAAVINLTFNKNSIDKWLGKAKTEDINEVQNNNAHFLIIPVLIRGKQTIIWEDYNYWRNALGKVIEELNLTSKYNLPIGEIDDMEMLSDAVIAKGDYPELKHVIDKYMAKEAIVAIAHYILDPKTNYPTVLLTTRTIDVSGEKKTEKVYSFKEGGSLHDLLETVAKDFLQHQGQQAKVSQPETKLLPPHNIKAIIKVKSFDDWMNIKKHIEDSELLSIESISEISISQAIVNIGVKGEFSEAISNLEERGLIIKQANNLLVISL